MHQEIYNSEQERYKEIVLATIDYEIERVSKCLESKQFEQLVQSYGLLKQHIEKQYQNDGLERLKKTLRSFTDWLKQLGNLNFGNYIKEKTRYNIDIFENIKERIDKIIAKKAIKNNDQQHDVLAMIQFCRKTSVFQGSTPLLQNLLQNYRRKNSKNSRKQNHYVNHLFEINSPDNKRFLTIYETNYTSTQIQIDFENFSAGIYSANGINLGIMSYWMGNNKIVIETRKDYDANICVNKSNAFKIYSRLNILKANNQ